MSRATLRDFATRLQTILEGVKVDQGMRLSTALQAMIEHGLKLLTAHDRDTLEAGKLQLLIAKAKKQQKLMIWKSIGLFKEDLSQLSLWQQQTERDFLQKGFKKASGFVAKTLARKALLDGVMSRVMHATGEKLEGFLENWSDRQIESMWQKVAIGFAQGKTTRDIAKSIQGTAARNFKDGHLAKSKEHARTVAHTAVQHVSTATRMELYVENDDLIKGYTFVATLDLKTSAVCQSLDNKTFKLDKGPLPPMHPNCRSTTIPELGPMFDFLDEGATRSAEQGPVKADLTYYEWLKKQSTASQDKVLGKNLGEVFRSKSMNPTKFAEMRLDKQFQPVKIRDILKQTGFVRDG
jgi:SPP1 gp7 family putative phage head morphogenesis protein